MQIVSEAIFEHLKQSPLLHTSTHNRLAYVTSTQLTVRQISINPMCSSLKVRGVEIAAISLQNPHYLIVLYLSGLLEVRKIEVLQQMVLTVKDVLIIENKLKVRATLDAIYILCANFVDKIYFSYQRQREQIYLSQMKNDYAEDMLISSILQEQKILIFKFPTVVSFEIEGIPIARLPFERVDEIKLLRDPLLIGNIEMKEYIVIIEMNRWLKVYEVVSLRQVLEMELFLQKNEEIEIKVDPLHEYIILRSYLRNDKKTTRNSLLKINKEYYLYQSKQPFFLFDIELGLKQDLILFPTHLEVINGSQFHSIDMCFFKEDTIKIATLVVDINHKTRLYHTHHFDPNWTSVQHWNQIISNLKHSDNPYSKQSKTPQLENKNESDIEWNKLIRQFLQQNIQKFQTQGLVFNFNKSNEDNQKCIELPRTLKDHLQMQDALNTLSGSSSFRSSGQAIHNEQMLLKMIQGVDLSVQSQKKRSQIIDPSENAQQEDSGSEVSETQEYLGDVEQKIGQIMKPIDMKIQEIQDKLGRIEDIHVKKLKRMERGIRQHNKEVNRLKQKIPNWCDDYMNLFGKQIKNSLNQFTTTVSRLEIMGTRRIKKLKKGYRDFVDEEIEVAMQKLQQNEQTYIKNIENLMKNLEME